jgi:hypothetical protein
MEFLTLSNQIGSAIRWLFGIALTVIGIFALGFLAGWVSRGLW